MHSILNFIMGRFFQIFISIIPHPGRQEHEVIILLKVRPVGNEVPGRREHKEVRITLGVPQQEIMNSSKLSTFFLLERFRKGLINDHGVGEVVRELHRIYNRESHNIPLNEKDLWSIQRDLLNGFFPGGRGLRQGDPMSPYLFVLAMEAFSGLMNSMVSEGKLKFHWKCDKEKISHLCFADDLLIFCKGEIHSVSCVAQCLEVFRQLSGLSPNPDKSNVFMCGIAANVGEQILSLLGYNAGCLPVRYLGVPLISSRLKGSDCRALVDRIIARAKSWTCRALSYAGRLQLVKIILFAIQVYRSSIFILPKAVIKQIEQTLRAFLWKGSDLSTRGAKVAWEYVCLPKKEGGLGLRGLEEWNRAAMLKHLWHICTDKEQSVWSSWIRTHLIRAKNFWELKIPGECTWAWRKILKLRPLARANFKFRVGNGSSISL